MNYLPFHLQDLLDIVAVKLKSSDRGAGVGSRISIAPAVPDKLLGDQISFSRALIALIELGMECSGSADIGIDIETAGGKREGDERSVVLQSRMRDAGNGMSREAAACVVTKFLSGGEAAGEGTILDTHASGTELIGHMKAGIGVECDPGSGFAVVLTVEFENGSGVDEGRRAESDPSSVPESRSEIRLPQGLERLRGAHVLLAEDHPVNQSLARDILAQAGCSVEIAENGKLAVDAVQERGDTFDAILMDVQMPIMDGFEATREIRNELGRSDLPIIAMTANVFGDERQRCLDEGMNDYVPKPVHIPDLYATLVRWIERRDREPDPSQRNAVSANASAASENGTAFVLPDHIPGIDVATGLSRSMGRPELYAELLLKFAESNETVADQAAAAIASGDREKARFLAHGLVSTAGNIGAETLCTAASNLEKALVGDDDVANEVLVAFRECLNEVTSGIRNAGVSPGHRPLRPGNGAGAFDREAASLAAETLASMLDDQDMAAHHQLDRLLECLGNEGQDDQLRRLKACVDDLEYMEAKQVLSGICEEILR
ncbi:MAG: response regulator [Rhodospirillales bacterium]|nr:MAG: response regulator [Rhodospirillales bacterium]